MLKASQVQYLNLRIRAAQNRILDAQTYVLTVQKAQLREKQGTINGYNSQSKSAVAYSLDS
jgi:hypothetical protein